MCRKYFPKTKSILMDRTTYDEFEQYKVDGKIFSNDERIKLKEFLTEDESDMMDFVYTNAFETGARKYNSKLYKYFIII